MASPATGPAVDVKAFESSPAASIAGIFQNDLFSRVDFLSPIKVGAIN